MRATCDACGKRFKPRPRREKRGDVERVYLKCPKCKKEYTAYYADSHIREKQARVRMLTADCQQARAKDAVEAAALMDTIRALRREIGRDMDRLKARV